MLLECWLLCGGPLMFAARGWGIYPCRVGSSWLRRFFSASCRRRSRCLRTPSITYGASRGFQRASRVAVACGRSCLRSVLSGCAGVLGYVALFLAAGARVSGRDHHRAATWRCGDGVCNCVGVEPVLAGLAGDRWTGARCWLSHRLVTSGVGKYPWRRRITTGCTARRRAATRAIG